MRSSTPRRATAALLTLLTLLTASAVLVGDVVLRPTAASASCADDSGPARSPVVFAGRAEEERRGFTRFSVRTVWPGPDLAPEVWVQSGQRQPPWPLRLLTSVRSSVDADFEVGETYLVGASEDFLTGACTSLPLADIARDPSAADSPPSGARGPSDHGSAGADPPIGSVIETGVVAGTVVAMIGVLVLARRRRAHA